MRVARFDKDWNFISSFMFKGESPVAHTQQMSDEQYELLRSGRAKWEPGKGLVLSDPGDKCVALRFMKRDHHAAGGSSPVRNRVHSCDEDQEVNIGDAVREMMMSLGMRDGDEFEVCVTPTGRRPHGDRWFLFPQGRPETDDEVLARIENPGETDAGVVVDMEVNYGNETNPRQV